MVNIDIMELYKMYAANPDKFSEILRNIIFHEFLVIHNEILSARLEIKGLDKNPLYAHDKSRQIIQIKELLDKLPLVFETGTTVTEFFRCTIICGKLNGEETRIKLSQVQAKVEDIKAQFYERLEQGITTKIPREEADALKEKNLGPAKELAVDLLSAAVDLIKETEMCYWRECD